MITSVHNPQIKNIIALNQKARARRDQGLFTAEGVKMFMEAPLDRIQKVYIAESRKGDEAISDKAGKCPMEIVADSVFKQMCDTQTPQGVLTVLKKPDYTLEDILTSSGGRAPLLVILEDLQDPGNLGTIIRTGEGAGISGIIMTRTCVDITNPKVIRSTMGSIYRVPYMVMEDLPAIKQKLSPYGIRLVAAHLKGDHTYDMEDYTGGTAFMIGNEGNGLTDLAAAAADMLIRIPMLGQVESLNAAMAAGILMYEAARQRR